MKIVGFFELKIIFSDFGNQTIFLDVVLLFVPAIFLLHSMNPSNSLVIQLPQKFFLVWL